MLFFARLSVLLVPRLHCTLKVFLIENFQKNSGFISKLSVVNIKKKYESLECFIINLTHVEYIII